MFGHSPRIHWNPNRHGAIRSLAEAVEIAKAHGVFVPEYVMFFVDELDWLDERTTARGPKITKAAGDVVVWEDMLNRFGKVPFVIRRDIMESDEAIVAVICHELHELQRLMPLLHEGQLTIEEFGIHTSPDVADNFHSEAWDVADQLVETMRKQSNDS